MKNKNTGKTTNAVMILLFAVLLALAGTIACGGTSDGAAGGGATSGGGAAAANGGAGVGGTVIPGGGTGGVAGVVSGTGGTVATGGTGATAGTVSGTGGAGTTGGTGGAGTTGGTGGLELVCDPAKPALPDGSCKSKAAGIYATKIVADVYWNPAADLLILATTDPGRGALTVYVKENAPGVCDNGEFQAEIVPCGIEIPPLTSKLLCDYINPVVPNSVWDSPDIKPEIVTGSTTSFDPGGFLSIPISTFLYGIDLTNPEGTWPTPEETAAITCPLGSGAECFPDYEGDTNPGVSCTFARLGEEAKASGCGLAGTDPWTYGAAPLSADPTVLFPGSNVATASILYVGTRFRGNGGGTIGQDCASGWGETTVEKFDLRLWSCIREEGSGTPPATAGQECTAAEALFMDQHLPNYVPLMKGDSPPTNIVFPDGTDLTPSKGAISYVVRLADPGVDVTCDQVRNAAYPTAN